MQQQVDGGADSLAPVIETARLILSGPRLEDFDGSRALWADPDVTRLIRDEPFTSEECWLRLLRYVGHWRLLGFGYWMAREKAPAASLAKWALPMRSATSCLRSTMRRSWAARSRRPRGDRASRAKRCMRCSSGRMRI